VGRGGWETRDWPRARPSRPTSLPPSLLPRFALDHPAQRLGLPTGQHITLKATHVDSGEDIMKPYTPVSDDASLVGAVDFVIKVYPQGRVSRALDALKIGETVLAKGPRGRFSYSRNMASAIGMVAGGTGVTPMYQVAAAALRDGRDETKISLVFANVSAADILIKPALDALARSHPTRFAVHYVLNEPPAGWTGSAGFVTPDVLKKHLPPPGPRTLVARCGPPPMNKAVAAALEGLGHAKESLFEF